MPRNRRYRNVRRNKMLRRKGKSVKKTTALIKRVIERQAETKFGSNDPVVYSYRSAAPYNASMSPAVDLLSTLWSGITQGTTQGSRIGNKIRIKQLNLVLSVSSSQPYIVQVWIGKLKETPSTLPDSTQLAKIYQDGSSVASSDGTLLALTRKVNKDIFTIVGYKKMVFNMNANSSDYNFKNITIPLKMKGVVNYNDTGTETNKYLFMWSNITYATGVAHADASINDNVRFNYYTYCSYTDF